MITELEISKIDDDGKLYERYVHKCINAKKAGVICELTYQEYCELVKQGGLVSSQLGFKSKDKYVLARYNDTGNYTITSCRFITQRDNIKERKISDDKMRKFQRAGLASLRCLSEEQKLRRKNSYRKTIELRHVGEVIRHNNTCWINKDNINKRIRISDLSKFTSSGWTKGRLHCFNHS